MTGGIGAGGGVRRAAVVGAGVICAGWAACLALSGCEVAVHDPDPEAEARLGRVLGDAERALARLIEAPRPAPGAIRFAPTLAEVVAEAELVQESAPERLDLKRALLAEIDRRAPPGAIVASSTSGLLPSRLQSGMGRPGRFLVAHPFNPVYLLPLVELVAGEATAPETVGRAAALVATLGMRPLVVRREIDAFVGDRLLEALWREALWLVRDEVASVEEIDDVIRHSFDLRRAQMGLFQTYRIAGGEGGMRHFLAQFGPCLQWPWTRLTDVPDLTPAVVERIAAQSDAQARGRSIRDLERVRDDNLVAILRALAGAEGGAGWGAGAVLDAYEADLRRRAAGGGGGGSEIETPLRSTAPRPAPIGSTSPAASASASLAASR